MDIKIRYFIIFMKKNILLGGKMHTHQVKQQKILFINFARTLVLYT